MLIIVAMNEEQTLMAGGRAVVCTHDAARPGRAGVDDSSAQQPL